MQLMPMVMTDHRSWHICTLNKSSLLIVYYVDINLFQVYDGAPVTFLFLAIYFSFYICVAMLPYIGQYYCSASILISSRIVILVLVFISVIPIHASSHHRKSPTELLFGS